MKQSEQDYVYADLHDEDVLAQALTAKSAVGRCMGRGVASGWPEKLSLWFNDEINRPDAKPAALLHALMLLQVQTLGSFVAGMTSPANGDHVVKIYLDMVADRLPKHIAVCREHEGGTT